MMMKMSNRKEELMNYINMLEGLSKSGFNCNKEINMALEELNALLFPQQERVFILVLEKDVDGVNKSSEAFSKLLDKGFTENRSVRGGHSRFAKGDKMIVEILNIKETNWNALRGMRPDLLIDNSEDPTIKDIVQEKKY
jgi:hypothetical protein